MLVHEQNNKSSLFSQMSPHRASSTDVNGEAEQPDDSAVEGVRAHSLCLSASFQTYRTVSSPTCSAAFQRHGSTESFESF